MSNPTETIFVTYVNINTKVVRYDYMGASHRTSSLRELVQTARKEGIALRYTHNVQAYLNAHNCPVITTERVEKESTHVWAHIGITI